MTDEYAYALMAAVLLLLPQLVLQLMLFSDWWEGGERSTARVPRRARHGLSWDLARCEACRDRDCGGGCGSELGSER